MTILQAFLGASFALILFDFFKSMEKALGKIWAEHRERMEQADRDCHPEKYVVDSWKEFGIR